MTPENFLERAVKCELAAQAVTSADRREFLLFAAAKWRAMADDGEMFAYMPSPPSTPSV
jgi:hypothetical protein